MDVRTRRRALAALAVLLALAFWVPGLGLVDLIAPWLLREDSLVHDVGYGAVTGLIVPLGLLAQAFGAERHVAGLQQAALGAVAYMAAGIAAAEYGYVALGAGALAAVGILLALHPIGGTFFVFEPEVNPVLAVLAGLAAIPLVAYALDAADAQRDGAPPRDFHVGLGSWAGLSSLGFAVVLVAFLAALRTKGWRIPAVSASAAVAIWAAAVIAYPGHAGSPGRWWGVLALAWAATFAAAAFAETRRGAEEPPGAT